MTNTVIHCRANPAVYYMKTAHGKKNLHMERYKTDLWVILFPVRNKHTGLFRHYEETMK